MAADGVQKRRMSETHDPTSRAPALCATETPGVGTFSNIDRERLVSAKRTRVAAHCEEDGSGNARLLRNSGGLGNVGMIRPCQPRHTCTTRLHGEGEVELQSPMTAKHHV